jgi:predicted RNA binding protein YcfA (HicA-like mRNA interferase family)
MVRFLLRKGWWIERIHGSHYILHHDNFPEVSITVAVHSRKSMPRRAIIATLKAADIRVEEFNREA